MKKIFFGFYVMITLFFISCKHRSQEFVGPSICPSDNFRIVSFETTTEDPVDLNTMPFNVNISFTEPVSWKVRFIGEETGAIKSYFGHTNSISLKWNGEPDNSTFFKDEMVIMELTIPCREPMIKSFKIHSNNFTTYKPLILDFESAGTSEWYIYGTGQNTFDIKTMAIAPHGNGYLHMSGDAMDDSWYSLGAGRTIDLSQLSSHNPDDVYLNAFVNNGGNTTTALGFTLRSGKYIYKTKLINLNWIGWRNISIKLSDYRDQYNNPITDASLLNGIEFSLNCASERGQTGEANIDMVMFTTGKPFFSPN